MKVGRVIALICFLCFNSVIAQNIESTKRPKVGVVLSGGGAKGLAHIGVLRVLEEQGIKVDYIAGTSMGAIIGGLYASGYTANELDSIFNTIDSSAFIRDYIPRISKSFYEKSNDEIYALSLPFDKFKLGLPNALSRGMNNYNLMNNLLAHVRHVRDFNDLNIPFLCITTDVETGKQVVLDKGYLPQVILASGAFPSLFAPVNIDGKYLIDGGVVNNYPVEELRKMGADIIIGVDVQDNLKKIEEINGASDLLLQISNYSTINVMKDKVPATDIYIKPDIVGFSVVSFDQGKVIIERGAAAASKVIDQLSPLGGDKNVLKQQYVPKFSGDLFINNIKINGLSSFTSRYIHGKLGFKPNSKITFEELSNGIDQLNATENFSSISYSFEKDGTHDDFILNLTENPVKRFLKLGLHYDGLMKSAALINLTQRNLFFKSDVVSLDVGLGDNVRYNFNYFVDNGFFRSIGFNSKIATFSKSAPYSILTDVMPNQHPIGDNTPKMFNLDYLDLKNRLFIQTFYKQKYLLGAGVEHRFLDMKSPTLSKDGNNLRIEESNYLGAFANFTIDTYDNKYFPRNGFLLKGEFINYFYASNAKLDLNNFSTIKGQLGYATQLTNKLTIDVRSRIGMSLGGNTALNMTYFLGGYGFADMDNILPFYGYDYLSIGGNSYITGLLQFDYEILKKHHINFGANIANVGKDIFEGMDGLPSVRYSGYALGYGFQTIIGPIEAKFSYSPDTGSTYTWFSVGFWF